MDAALNAALLGYGLIPPNLNFGKIGEGYEEVFIE